MLEFDEVMVLTGVEQRTNKEGKPYIIINFLGETGQTFGTVASCEIPSDIKQLDKVNVKFKVFPGRYTQLKTLSIKKVA